MRKKLLLKTTERDIESVQHLIATDVDLNIQDENGMTALMIASQNGDLELVEQFIKGGADLNMQALFGDTALIHANQEPTTRMCKETFGTWSEYQHSGQGR